MFNYSQQQSTTGVAVRPKDPNQATPIPAGQRPVRMYFIGVKLMRPIVVNELVEVTKVITDPATGAKSERLVKENQATITAYAPPTMISRQRQYPMPPIGGMIEVPQLVAQELIRDGAFWEFEREFPAFTADAHHAQAVKERWEEAVATNLQHAKNCLDESPIEKLVFEKQLAGMSMEELEAELARRKQMAESVASMEASSSKSTSTRKKTSTEDEG